MIARVVAVWAIAAAAGCGLGLTDERSGGAENLPTAGLGPYQRIPFVADSPIDEPVVLEQPFFSFEHPSALSRADGGFRIWFTRIDPLEAPASEIWYAELPDVHSPPDRGPEPGMVATEPWEAGRVTAPHVLELGGGALVMFYEAGDPTAPVIGRADSADDGATWVKHPDNPLLVDATDPTVVVVDGQWTLYATRPSAVGIFLADSVDGVGFQFASEPVIESRPDVEEAFDRFGVGQPVALVRKTAADRPVFSLFFNGADGPDEDSDVAVGAAASFDGFSWVRFSGPDAVLRSRGPDVQSPAVVVRPTEAFMFFHELSGAGLGKISAARHP